MIPHIIIGYVTQISDDSTIPHIIIGYVTQISDDSMIPHIIIGYVTQISDDSMIPHIIIGYVTQISDDSTIPHIIIGYVPQISDDSMISCEPCMVLYVLQKKGHNFGRAFILHSSSRGETFFRKVPWYTCKLTYTHVHTVYMENT